MKPESEVREELEKSLKEGVGPKAARYALACLGGLVPFAGGMVSGAAGAWSESDQERINNLFQQWLKMQEEEMLEIGQTLFEVFIRIDKTDQKIQERIQSHQYLSIIKKCFRDWSAAESEPKRIYIRNLLANAASCEMTTDDVIKFSLNGLISLVKHILRLLPASIKIHISVVKEFGVLLTVLM